MLEDLRKQFQSFATQLLIFLLIIAVGVYLFQTFWQFLSIFSDIFIILIFAWLVSFILEPLVTRLTNKSKIKKVYAAGVVYTLCFVLFISIMLLFIPATIIQFQKLSHIFPSLLSFSTKFTTQQFKTITPYLYSSLPLLPSVAQFILYLFITLIVSFYMVIDKEQINEELYSLLPRRWHVHIHFIQALIENVFGSFLRVQLVLGIITGVITWIILQLYQVPFADLTSLLAGLLTMIPLIGPVLGLLVPVLIALTVNPFTSLFVFITLFFLQQILFNIIGPKLLGDALKLHPIIVILSFFIGYKIAGSLGAIFAVPVFGILAVLFHRISRYVFQTSRKS